MRAGVRPFAARNSYDWLPLPLPLWAPLSPFGHNVIDPYPVVVAVISVTSLNTFCYYNYCGLFVIFLYFLLVDHLEILPLGTTRPDVVVDVLSVIVWQAENRKFLKNGYLYRPLYRPCFIGSAPLFLCFAVVGLPTNLCFLWVPSPSPIFTTY